MVVTGISEAVPLSDPSCIHPPGTSSCEEKLLRLAQWAWQPNSCTLLPFDASFLSQKLSGKRVHFVGDSTMRQQFWALGLLMKARGMIDVDVFRTTEWTTRHNATFSVDGVQFLTGPAYVPSTHYFSLSDVITHTLLWRRAITPGLPSGLAKVFEPARALRENLH